MRSSNKLKYAACPHAQEYLLQSKITIAEATGDLFWGMGLGVQQSLDCLLDFWLGANHMGQILMEIWADCQAELQSDERKCKAESPLTHDQSKTIRT